MMTYTGMQIWETMEGEKRCTIIADDVPLDVELDDDTKDLVPGFYGEDMKPIDPPKVPTQEEMMEGTHDLTAEDYAEMADGPTQVS